MLSFLLLIIGFFICDQVQSQDLSCKFLVNTIDEYTGKIHQETENVYFFSFSPKAQKRNNLDEDFLKVEGQVIRKDDDLSLLLTFVFRTKDAEDGYGSIAAGTALQLYDLKSKKIELKTEKGAQIVKTNQAVMYKCNFTISNKDIKALKTFEIDAISLNFTKGYQRFDVYYLDFLSDHLNCIFP